jgi:diacylglycerol kinase family enzyme
VTRQLGILINANAKRAKRDPAVVERLRRHLPPERVKATTNLEEIAPALDALLAQPLDALLLVGGDGTLAQTLTTMIAAREPEKLPAIVPTRGGTVNTVATSLGARGTPEQTLATLLRGDPFREERRAVVRVVADGAEPVFGFLFANGVGARFLELYYEDSPMGPAGALSVLSRITGSALVGGALARRMFAPFEAELSVDGSPLEKQRFTVIMAGGVRHIGLGFPVCHSAGSDPEKIHLATTAASPAEIALQLPALRAGSPSRSLSHYVMRRAELRFEEPLAWTIDAEFFPPASRLEISAGPALRFRTPRRLV